MQEFIGTVNDVKFFINGREVGECGINVNRYAIIDRNYYGPNNLEVTFKILPNFCVYERNGELHIYTEKIVTDPVVELWLKTFDDFEEVWLYDGSSVEMEEAYASELLGFRTAYNIFNEKLEKQKEQYEERIRKLNDREDALHKIKELVGDRCFDTNCSCLCDSCDPLTYDEQHVIMKLLDINARLVCHKEGNED